MYSCQYEYAAPGAEADDPLRCGLFFRGYSTAGFGYTFNAEGFWEVLQKKEASIGLISVESAGS